MQGDGGRGSILVRDDSGRGGIFMRNESGSGIRTGQLPGGLVGAIALIFQDAYDR